MKSEDLQSGDPFDDPLWKAADKTARARGGGGGAGIGPTLAVQCGGFRRYCRLPAVPSS
jgi:hypothetical protein